MSDSKDKPQEPPVTHAGYADIWRKAIKGELDGRSLVARAVRELKQNLINDLGGEDRISTSERIIIDRAVVKTLKAQSFETMMLEGEPMSKSAEELYLSITNSLRKDLSVIGFERRARPVEKQWDLHKLSLDEIDQLYALIDKVEATSPLTPEEQEQLKELQRKAGQK